MMLSLSLSCSKDEDINITDNIGKIWKMESYEGNNVDVTSTINITYYMETYNSEGLFSRSYLFFLQIKHHTPFIVIIHI